MDNLIKSTEHLPGGCCHEELPEYKGMKIAEGTIKLAYKMLSPKNDMFLVVLKSSGKTRKFRREELRL